MKTTLHFDGSCVPNLGSAACGWVIEDECGVLSTGHKMLGPGTSNTAEYQALVFGDSQVVIRRMQGKSRGKPKSHLIPLILKARVLETQFKSCRFQWVPREKNQTADDLSNIGQGLAASKA